MKKLFIAACLFLSTGAFAQTVQQSGSVTPGHAVRWLTNGVVGDAGSAATGNLTSLGVTASGPGICQNSGPITSPYNAMCLNVTQAGGGQLSLYNHGGATGGFSFNINGTTQGFGIVALPVTIGNTVCVANSAGNLQDCGSGPFGGLANPTATVSGSVVNGTATTAMRSDAAPALANTAVSAGSYGGSTSIPSFTVDAQGRLTAAAANVVIAPAGTLSGSTLAAGVTSSSLTGVGTLTSGATGAGFTLAVATSTISGIFPIANLPVATSSTLGIVKPDNLTVSISGGVLTAIGATASSVTVGVTTIGSGSSTGFIYDDAGVIGNTNTNFLSWDKTSHVLQLPDLSTIDTTGAHNLTALDMHAGDAISWGSLSRGTGLALVGSGLAGFSVIDFKEGSTAFSRFVEDTSNFYIQLGSNGLVGFATTADPTAAPSVGFSYGGFIHTLALGNGTIGDATGVLKLATLTPSVQINLPGTPPGGVTCALKTTASTICQPLELWGTSTPSGVLGGLSRIFTDSTYGGFAIQSQGIAIGYIPRYFQDTGMAIEILNGGNAVVAGTLPGEGSGGFGNSNLWQVGFQRLNTAAQSSTALFLSDVYVDGAITGHGAITGGSLYTTGTYTSVPLTGGAGKLGTATIVVSGGAVTSVTITFGGFDYVVGNTLSASAANIGGTGSGLSCQVSSVNATNTNVGPTLVWNSTSPYFIGIGQNSTSSTDQTLRVGAVGNFVEAWSYNTDAGVNLLLASGALQLATNGGGTTTCGAQLINASGTVNVTQCNSTTKAPLAAAGITANGATSVVSASFGLTGNIASAAWTTNGVRYKNTSATLTDTTSSGTVAAAYTDLWGGNTIAASSATTFTNYYSSYFKAPSAGANVTLTKGWALGADSLSVAGKIQANVTSGEVARFGSTTDGTSQVDVYVGNIVNNDDGLKLSYQGSTGDILYDSLFSGSLHHFKVVGTDYTTIGSAKLAVLQTTSASSSTTGALTVAGGAGIAGSLYVGGSIVPSGQLKLVNAVSSVTAFEVGPASGAGTALDIYGSASNGGTVSIATNYAVTDGNLDIHTFDGGAGQLLLKPDKSITMTGSLDAVSYKAGGTAGADCASGSAITNIVVKKGIVTSITATGC